MKPFYRVLSLFITVIMIAGLFQILPSKMSAAGVGNDTAGMDEELNKRLAGAVVLYIGSPQALVNNGEKQVDPVNGEVAPFSVNGRALVPVRFIAENLGAEVSWEKESAKVTVLSQEKAISFVLGSDRMFIDGVEHTLEVSAQVVDGRTFVPLRAVSEAFGKKVFYDRGLIIISSKDNLFDTGSEKSLLDRVIARVNNLPVVGSEENLQKLLADVQAYSGGIYRNSMMLEKSMAADSAQSAAPTPAAQDYSTTNIQVQGVDEADIVKTDGSYIYQVSKNRVVVTKACPAEEMKTVGNITFTDQNFNPQELYVDQQYLVVIGTTQNTWVEPVPGTAKTSIICPPLYFPQSTKALIYDIKNPEKIEKLREVELTGRYVSSRKIGTSLYLVAHQYLNYYSIQEQCPTPSYRDTAAGEQYVQIPYERIRYIPPLVYPSYLVIAGVDLARPDSGTDISTYLGSSENIYVSPENMYVAITGESRVYPEITILGEPAGASGQKTRVYKFSLNKSKVTYLGKGEVPGTILNQFSMDEFQNNFRIATTTGQVWRTDELTSKNNVYILDENLGMIGKVENIAPGEKIYSTRFRGERAYMVTFKTVDPLFVLDLKEPTNPRILGALKIPGYSDYLHPYDQDHIIGFGKDTVEIAQKDYQGNVTGTTAFYRGMKIALFDVSDVNHPIQKFSETIGDRGTDSELLRNHKALLFDKNRGLLAFPITVYEVKDAQINNQSGIPQYGQFTFQGAYLYKLDLVDGFVLKGRVTHLSAEDYLKAGYRSYDYDKAIKRTLYIGDTFYTLSNSMIKAQSLEDMKEKSVLELTE